MFCEGEAVDDIARFDGFDGHAIRGFGGVQAVSANREGSAERVDELVHLGHVVAIVEPALELVSQQIGEALSIPDAFDHGECGANPLGGEVDGHGGAVGGAGVRDEAVPQHRGRDRVIQRGRVDVALVGAVPHEGRIAGSIEFRDQLGIGETNGREDFVLGLEVFEPGISAKVYALSSEFGCAVADVAHHGELIVDDA
jgi:hypothetical protein